MYFDPHTTPEKHKKFMSPELFSVNHKFLSCYYYEYDDLNDAPNSI